MRILHISTRLILGGSQENTVLSCEGQARLGHDVHLAFGPIYGPEGSLLGRVEAFNRRCASGEEITQSGAACRPITTHVVPDMIRAIHPLRDRRALGQLKDLIRIVQPDIVHTHSSKAGIIGRQAAWAMVTSGTAHPGIVHTIHGPPFMPIEGGPLKRLRRRLTNHAYTLAERSAAKHCHVIVSVADAMTRQFLDRRIGRPEQYVTVRSGIDTGPYLHAAPGESRGDMRRSLGLADSDLVIGTVARLAEHKGHDDLLDALADDLRTHPRWKLLWVGDGWWRERLIARARQLGLGVAELDREAAGSSRPTAASAQVVITGLVPPDHIPAHLRVMDILVHPSYREGLPRTVPQALLCRVCPVAYDADGTGEVCIDGHTGRLVPVGDRARLREAIAQLAADPALRATLAENGHRLCREQFSAEAMVAGLEAVYIRAARLAAQPR